MHTEVSVTAEISQIFAKPSKSRTWIANAGDQNFVIEINVWSGIYNYCYTKVFAEFSIFQFSCTRCTRFIVVKIIFSFSMLITSIVSTKNRHEYPN